MSMRRMKLMSSGVLLMLSLALLISQGFAQVLKQQSSKTEFNRKIRRLDGSAISSAEVDRTVTRLMNAARVTGLSLAILNDSKIVYVKSFGLRNREESKPLTEQTVMYGASYTKAVFAYFVMQLVEEGVINLDKPIYQYLEKPLPEYEKYKDLASHERYKLITARMLLSHTSGFPNFRWLNADEKLDIKFTPGTKYAYSGEGINLLQFVIEAITKQSIADMMRERIFKPFGMTSTSMTWEERFGENYAVGYDEKEKPLGHKQRSSARAAGSMDTTISDYAKFMQAVMQGKGLASRYKREMLTPQIQIYSKYQFPTLSTETTEENRAIELSYGLGWGLFRTPFGKAFFKEGHDDGWENHSVCFPDREIAIIFMANSSNGDSIFKELLETLIRDKYTPWKWEGYVAYDCTD